MTLKEIASRFPDLKVGEVIYVFANGVVFNKGTNDARRKNARAYGFKHPSIKMEMVEKKPKKVKESTDDKNDKKE